MGYHVGKSKVKNFIVISYGIILGIKCRKSSFNGPTGNTSKDQKINTTDDPNYPI